MGSKKMQIKEQNSITTKFQMAFWANNFNKIPTQLIICNSLSKLRQFSVFLGHVYVELIGRPINP